MVLYTLLKSLCSMPFLYFATSEFGLMFHRYFRDERAQEMPFKFNSVLWRVVQWQTKMYHLKITEVSPHSSSLSRCMPGISAFMDTNNQATYFSFSILKYSNYVLWKFIMANILACVLQEYCVLSWAIVTFVEF
jgi:hypothetical protein